MVELKIVPIHEGPSLAEIPAQLRAMADAIEAGAYGEVDGLFVVMPRDQAYQKVFGWGINSGAFEPIIQLELARQWLVHAAVGLPTE